MNFLAHVYLSGDNDLIRIGNFVGDYIKGNEHKNYMADIQKGILMHRFIDSYTDSHPNVRQSKSRLNDKYHKYSGIIIDIFYDHFLARNWNVYSSVLFRDFIADLNKSLQENMHYFSEEVQEFIPRFMKFGWIESYATLEGIELVLKGMSRHTSLPDKTIYAISILEEHYESFQSEFFDFFPQLINNVEVKFKISIDKVI